MERLDRTGFGELKIFQDTESFCYGIDAVILSYFASQGIKKENQLEIGRASCRERV